MRVSSRPIAVSGIAHPLENAAALRLGSDTGKYSAYMTLHFAGRIY